MSASFQRFSISGVTRPYWAAVYMTCLFRQTVSDTAEVGSVHSVGSEAFLRLIVCVGTSLAGQRNLVGCCSGGGAFLVHEQRIQARAGFV